MNNSGKTSGCLLAAIIFLIVVIIAMAAVYFIFFLNRSGMPDIDEFISEVESSERTTDNNSSITDLIKIQSDDTGTSVYTFILTNADLTALANDTIDSNDSIPMEDILVNCNADRTIDLTAVITDITVFTENEDIPAIAKTLMKTVNGKRMYATLYINYTGGEFDISIEDIKIGKLNIPFVEQIFKPMTDDISKMLNDQLDTVGNFELQSFLVEENQINFSGIATE